ncbi:hypothetical protein GLAREA_04170 [Glarea lozoyensis ATCC 20868]|uniref:Uncharacterized protein n=1 Tax=Glarea lozoyensis (strain ATCC 20868 / MF5171) TaxID=1116229 RepID=S3DXX4_GLAL2|nr:uncharacterized protein GLAREA_04170 [Glarea lozoyensis ATCC 20868]EPE31203.1 hypothetical protein GLAREA_04170 [Glarea lozoyensis ATCC 20868]
MEPIQGISSANSAMRAASDGSTMRGLNQPRTVPIFVNAADSFEPYPPTENLSRLCTSWTGILPKELRAKIVKYVLRDLEYWDPSTIEEEAAEPAQPPRKKRKKSRQKKIPTLMYSFQSQISDYQSIFTLLEVWPLLRHVVLKQFFSRKVEITNDEETFNFLYRMPGKEMKHYLKHIRIQWCDEDSAALFGRFAAHTSLKRLEIFVKKHTEVFREYESGQGFPGGSFECCTGYDEIISIRECEKTVLEFHAKRDHQRDIQWVAKYDAHGFDGRDGFHRADLMSQRFNETCRLPRGQRSQWDRPLQRNQTDESDIEQDMEFS